MYGLDAWITGEGRCSYCGQRSCDCQRKEEREEELLYCQECECVDVKVYCLECKAWYDETDVKCEDIEEDILGADVLTFTCPKGHEGQKSIRYG